jgi:hypothetical protein
MCLFVCLFFLENFKSLFLQIFSPLYLFHVLQKLIVVTHKCLLYSSYPPCFFIFSYFSLCLSLGEFFGPSYPLSLHRVELHCDGYPQSCVLSASGVCHSWGRQVGWGRPFPGFQFHSHSLVPSFKKISSFPTLSGPVLGPGDTWSLSISPTHSSLLLTQAPATPDFFRASKC